MNISKRCTQLIIILVNSANDVGSDIDRVTLQQIKAVWKAISSVFCVLSCSLLCYDTVEADCLSWVLDQVDQFRISNEVSNEDMLS